MKFKHIFSKVTTDELVEEQLRSAHGNLRQAQANREASELDVRLITARIAVLEQFQLERAIEHKHEPR